MISCMTRAPGSYRSSAGEMWKLEKCFSLDIPFYRTSGPNASESPVSQDLCNDLRAILCVLLIRNWHPGCAPGI